MSSRAMTILLGASLFLGSCTGTSADDGSAQGFPSSAVTSSRGPSRHTPASGSIPQAAPTFNVGTVLIGTPEGAVLVNVEVAESEEQHSHGLMNRESLPPDHGMVFLFFQETEGPFHMKNTRIPLSIAFFDRDGRILEILDMAPCKSEPCRLYYPGVTYAGALEVNKGAFTRWGVSEGDRISLTQDGI